MKIQINITLFYLQNHVQLNFIWPHIYCIAGRNVSSLPRGYHDCAEVRRSRAVLATRGIIQGVWKHCLQFLLKSNISQNLACPWQICPINLISSHRARQLYSKLIGHMKWMLWMIEISRDLHTEFRMDLFHKSTLPAGGPTTELNGKMGAISDLDFRPGLAIIH